MPSSLTRGLLPALLLLSILAPLAAGQGEQTTAPQKIAWLGVWSEAKELAAASGKPIFLLSAAPQCRNVPGIW